MAETHDNAAAADDEFFPLNDLPNQVLVSVFAVAAAEDATWARHTFPLVCRAWTALYRSQDASPLHETLEVDFEREVESAEAAAAAAREREGHRDPVEGAPRRPVVHASRVISWAEGRAGSVRKLRLVINEEEDLGDFSSEDLGAVVASVGSSLTKISIGPEVGKLCEKPFWESLRTSVAHAGRLRSLRLAGVGRALLESDVEPLGQLAGSLEELVLGTESDPLRSPLSRFPESLCALKELRCLSLVCHTQITAISAGISSLKKLEELELTGCGLSSLPKELGELSGLTRLDLSGNYDLGTTLPSSDAFPTELGKMKSLRVLSLSECGLDTVPSFVGELKSLESLELSFCALRTVPSFVGELKSLESLGLLFDGDQQIDAPLDFLIEGCPRLRAVNLYKHLGWTPESLAHLEAFEANLHANNPSAEVSIS